MNRSEDLERERRGWHIGKDIPIALIITALCLFAGGVTGYTRVQSSIAYLTESSTERGRQLDELSRRVQESYVPAALNAARISALEASIGEIKARVAELERRR